MSSHPEFLDTLPAPDGAVSDPALAVPAVVLDDSAMFQDSVPRKQQPLVQSSEELPYQNWDRYKIVAFLGAGGMGTVYKARDQRLNRSVAIKFLRCNQADAFAKRQRRHFEREAKAQASIEHPNICKIYEVGEVEGQPYIAMQLIQGSSLAGLRQMLSQEEKVRVILQIAEALHAAHLRNLIHRDIKPSNIIVERRPDGSWWPYLLDFGLAREVDTSTLTSLGGVEGTPAFMAPEQARGESRSLDARTDVYGLGVALFCALAGRPPFVGNSTEVLMAISANEPPLLRTLDPSIPPALETIASKCLEKEPKRRYQSALALAQDLGRYLGGELIFAQPHSLLRVMGRSATRHKLLVASVSTALVATAVLAVVTLRIRWEAAEQSRLAEQLGQEISKMEWLLRSARQLPLHDLDREKKIVRQRMMLLQTELASYGKLSRGLAHYALGRGHMALHEYPQALTELDQASQLGVQSAEINYARGFVLGKYFEQSMYEARLAGGGDWATKQLKDIEPKYLIPAIVSLQRSRSMKFDAPQYLEGLIAYYQRDYGLALKQAQAALVEAPWLYEASKLAGDVHIERALYARDRGRYEEAEIEFAGGVKSYEAAAAVGQSDGEVYEGLAEAWGRRIEMAVSRGQPSALAYDAAVAASDKIAVAEPHSIEAPLKKAFAAMLTMSVTGSGSSVGATQRVQQCLSATDEVLRRQPGHPYASDVAASCTRMAAEGAQERGEDPKPLLRKALELLEPTVKQNPRFLWGLNDLGNIYVRLGLDLQLHGKHGSKEMLEKSIDYYSAAVALDATYVLAASNALWSLTSLVSEANSETELQTLLLRSDEWLAKCKSVNRQNQQCFNNYFQGYALAASRTFSAGRNPQPRLSLALENLAQTRNLGGNLLDAEQHAALSHFIDASDRMAHHQDPQPALVEIAQDLDRCFAISAHDAMCLTLAAQTEWLQIDLLASQGKSIIGPLDTALSKALRATESPETYPDAWRTLADSFLRMARAEQSQPKVRARYLSAGLVAAGRVLAINPNHAQGLAMQGALQLVRAQDELDPSARTSTARLAARSLAEALIGDPFLTHSYSPLLITANALVQQGL